MMFSSLFSILALAAAVNAHGYVDTITVDGKTYNGPIPGETDPKSPIRRITTIDPYKLPGGPGITCGLGAKAAVMVVPATAGSNLDLTWVAHPKQFWPHDMGPLVTYMAKVPTGQTADKFDAAKGEYFKIAQAGQDGKKWEVAKLMKLGTKHTVTIPKGIENGDYIVRHEIIALHLADKPGGAEFYSSCFQLRVTGGTGGANFAQGQTVSFPGAYTAKDAGIYTPKVFDSGFQYSFPGPAIFTSNGSSSNSTAPATSKAPTSTSKSSTRSATSSAPEPTSTSEPAPTTPDEDDCTEDEPETTSTGAASPEPTSTDEDCTDEEPETSSTPVSSTKASKPTGKTHSGYRRAQSAARGWGSRMERRLSQ